MGMAGNRRIRTNNREIYEKFNMLNFSPEVILKGVRKIQVDKIVRSINKKSNVLDVEVIGDYILVKKIGPINYDIYLNK